MCLQVQMFLVYCTWFRHVPVLIDLRWVFDNSPSCTCVFAQLLFMDDWIIIHTDWVLPEIPCEGRCKGARMKDRNNLKNVQFVANHQFSTACCPGITGWIGHGTRPVFSWLDRFPKEMCSRSSRCPNPFKWHLSMYRSNRSTLRASQMSDFLP